MRFSGAVLIILVALCCIYIAVVSGQPYSQQRIVGGTLATISQYPSIAALLYSGNLITYTQACGGSIITTRSILTAAHCVSGDQPARWRVRVGSSFSNSGGVLHTASSLIVHSAFNPRINDNDVAIIRLANTVNYTNVIAPASIAGANYNLPDNQVVWAAGWGSTSFGGPTSEQLRHVQIWSINQVTCKARYAYLSLNVTDNMLCSGWLDVGGRDQCQGDSGGPLYHNGVVVGICSWGAQCALSYYPGVNTRVSRFTSWIQANA